MSQGNHWRRAVRSARAAAPLATLAAALVAACVAEAAPPAAPSTSPSTSPSARSQTQPTSRPSDVLGADPVANDPAIRFWETRTRAAPKDPSLPARLGGVCLERAALSHDFRLYARAESAAKESLHRVPDYFPSFLLLGSCYLGEHRFAEAQDVAEQALKLRDGAPEAIALRGDARLQLGDLAGARADYQKLVDHEADLVTLVRVANLQFAEGDAAGSLKTLEKALDAGGEQAASPPLLAWGLVRLGEMRFRTGDWAGAETCYKQAIEFRADDPDLLDHLAEFHAASRDYPAALSYSAQALAIAPRPEFQQSRGDIYAIKGDAENARACYDKAVAMYLAAANAGHAHYYHHLAGLYSDAEALRNPAEAKNWARKDLASRRTTPTLDAMAWALYQGGKYAESAATMDDALRQKTADSHILYHAGLIYARAGDLAKGRACLVRAGAANPKFTEFHFHR